MVVGGLQDVGEALRRAGEGDGVGQGVGVTGQDRAGGVDDGVARRQHSIGAEDDAQEGVDGGAGQRGGVRGAVVREGEGVVDVVAHLGEGVAGLVDRNGGLEEVHRVVVGGRDLLTQASSIKRVNDRNHVFERVGVAGLNGSAGRDSAGVTWVKPVATVAAGDVGVSGVQQVSKEVVDNALLV